MKHTILTIMLLAVCFCAGAQEKTRTASYTKEGKTFVQSKSKLPYEGDAITAYKWRDAKGNEYPIILHTYTKGEKKGRTAAYVIRVSARTGNEYPYWIPDGEKIAEDIIKEGER